MRLEKRERVVDAKFSRAQHERRIPWLYSVVDAAPQPRNLRLLEALYPVSQSMTFFIAVGPLALKRQYIWHNSSVNPYAMDRMVIVVQLQVKWGAFAVSIEDVSNSLRTEAAIIVLIKTQSRGPTFA
jgi:hypothetical protein